MKTIEKQARGLIRNLVDRVQFTARKDTIALGHGGCAWHVCDSLLMKSSSPVMFSGGAGNDISFEQHFVARYNGRVFLYDPSPTGRKTFSESADTQSISFIPAALAKADGMVSMDKPKNSAEGSWTTPRGGSGSDDFRSVSLVNEIRRNGYSTVDVVKLDIEGFEYEVIDELLDSDISVGQILLEFHDFFASIPRSRTDSLRRRLTAAGYSCFYKKRYDFSYLRRE